MISPIASTTSTERPACDIDRLGGFPACPRCRCSRCRTRSSAREAVKSASRRALSCRARRRNRHCLPQVICVLVVDGAGMYQRRHSQHRRRHLLSFTCFIPRRSPRDSSDATSPPPSPLRSTPQGGSLRRRQVDLSQAAAKDPPVRTKPLPEDGATPPRQYLAHRWGDYPTDQRRAAC